MKWDMMKVPNAQRAIIDVEKLQRYILSPAHPVGRFKAAFFRQFGYSAENWEEFERHLRGQILPRDVSRVEDTPYGRKFVVEGPLVNPAGEVMQIITVWVILKKESVPRFVTAYPGGLG